MKIELRLLDHRSGEPVDVTLDSDTSVLEVRIREKGIGHRYESLAHGLPFEKDFEPYLMTIEEKKIVPANHRLVRIHRRFEYTSLQFSCCAYQLGPKWKIVVVV